jgi:hypothetical protein
MIKWITNKIKVGKWKTLTDMNKHVKEHDSLMKEHLLELTSINSALKDAVKGTKEQTAAIIEKLSSELEHLLM